MSIKHISFFLFFSFIATSIYPNFKLFPGYYINKNGDSVRCNIEFNDRNLNPKTIKVEMNNEKREFSANDIRGFGVYGYDDYLSATVSFHSAAVLGNDIPEQFSDSVSTKTCFLKILNRGRYSLYSLALPQRIYLFMGHNDSSIAELIYRVRNNNNSLLEDQSYKKAIFNLFVEKGISDEYFNRINKISYSASEIQSLFNILNGSPGNISHHEKASGEFQVQLYVGGVRNSFPTKFAGSFSNICQFEPSYSIGGGVNMLYSIPVSFKAFKVGLSMGYNSYNCKSTNSGETSFYQSVNYHGSRTYDDTVTTKNSFIQTNLYLMYLINPLNKMKFYIKAGINYSFSLNVDGSINEKNSGTTSTVTNGNPPVAGSFQNSSHGIIPIKKNYLTPMFAIGVIKERHTLEFSYYLPSDIGKNISNINGSTGQSFKISSMTLYYYYSLFPIKK